MKLSIPTTTLLISLLTLLTPATSQACPPGLLPGLDTVLYTIPYTYTQTLSIISSFRNLTWSGTPYSAVTLNGTNNTPGTARTYDLAGAHVVETLLTYSAPASPGPYIEIHALNYLTVPLPTGNVSLSAAYDGTTVTAVCGGAASALNLTAVFCATDVKVAGALLHQLHLGDAQTVGVFLGGRNFTSCAQFGASSASTTGTGTATATATPVVFTGAAVRGMGRGAGVGGVVLGLAGVAALLL